MVRKKNLPATGLKRYSVCGTLSVGVYTVVEAESPDQAREIAESRGVQTVCHQCAGGDETDEWCLSDSLNGDVEPGEEDECVEELDA